MNSIDFVDNLDELFDKLEDAYTNALTECGDKAVGHAVMLCPVDNGTLRGDIRKELDPDNRIVYIGSTLEYAVYVEMGTGKYYKSGRKTPWSYKDEENHWHYTEGQKAQPYLKPAVEDYGDEYKKVINDEFQKIG